MLQRSYRRRHRASGFALMALLVLITLGGLYFFVNNLTPQAIELRRQQYNTDVLKQAKDALLGYALTYRDKHPNEVFGYLPCPDTVGDGTAQAGNCAAGQASVGLLPYQSLNIGPLRDADGNCLWYAVAANYKAATTKPTPMNWDAQGQFSIVDSSATLVAPEDTHGGAVAVIFAPGVPVVGQTARTNFGAEPCAVDPSEVAKYLDGGYNFAVSTTIAITQGVDKSTTNNDLLTWITVTDIFDQVVKRADFKNTATASPVGQLNFLASQIKIKLEKLIQTDLIAGGSPSTSLPITTNYTQFSKNIGTLPALAAPTTAAYTTYYSNWQDQFRLVVGSTLASPTLSISGVGCRGALMFGGRASQPRTAQQKPTTTSLMPAGTATLANYFETGSGLEILNSSTTSFSGNTIFDGTNPATDSATCLFPGTFASLAQDSAALTTSTSSSTHAEVLVDTSAKTITLGNTDTVSGGVSAGSGCTWLPAANFGSLLRVYFRFQVVNRGQGFTLAIADEGTNNPTNGSTVPTMCGGSGSQLGYAGQQPVTNAVISPPKIGVEFDTSQSSGFGDPSFDHLALLFWGNTASASDDNTHGAGTFGDSSQPENPGTAITRTPSGFLSLSPKYAYLSATTWAQNFASTVVPYNSASPTARVFHVRVDASRRYDTSYAQWKYTFLVYATDNPLPCSLSVADFMDLSTDLSTLCTTPFASIEQDDIPIDDPTSNHGISISYDSTQPTLVSVSSTANHNLSTGQTARISGVSPTTYNGDYSVTVIDPTHFTYTTVSDPGVYVSGGSLIPGSIGIASVSAVGKVVSVAMATNHYLSTGQVIDISGVTPTSYNGRYVATVIDSTHFSYTTATAPGTYVSGGALITPALSRIYLGLTNGQLTGSGTSGINRQKVVVSNLLMRSE